MKLFIDSANVDEIRRCLERGAAGITTNPSLVAKEPQSDYVDLLRPIVDIASSFGKKSDWTDKQMIYPSLSVEVFSENLAEMLGQARVLREKLRYPALAVKIPAGRDGLQAIRVLKTDGIKVNCTCIFTEAQAFAAANAGADFVSVFWGRLKDIGGDPGKVIETVRKVIDRNCVGSAIIAGSIRSASDAADAFYAGAHIVTAPEKVWIAMTQHPQTDKSVTQFLDDFRKWSIRS